MFHDSPRSRCARACSAAVRAVLLPMLAFFAPLSTALAQSSTGRLKTLTLEELMDVDVTSVTRRSEPVGHAAAAVDVLTGEELRRSGATTLPEALRLAAGLFVARSDGHTWSISARGFAAPSSDKLLVLIDGRSVYTPLFSGVFWDVQNVVLDDVERIEVIRGPGATLWGANAVNGVINVITKPSSRTVGGLVELGTGTAEPALGTIRYGDQLGALGYRVFAKYNYLDANRTASGEHAHDPLRRGTTGGRVDWTISRTSELTLVGAGYRAAAGLIDRPDAIAFGWNVLGRYRRTLSSDADVQVQAYYDRTSRDVPRQFGEDRGTWDLDVQFRARPHPRHALLAGGGYRLTRDVTAVPDAARAEPGDVFVRFDPRRRTSPLWSAYLQDELEVVPDRLFLTAGARFEHNDFSGFEVQPTLRGRWTFARRGTVWAAVSRAVRTPSRLDADVRIEGFDGTLVLVGGPGFDSEEVIAVEGGYRIQVLRMLLVDIAAYHNRYDRLRSQEAGPTIVLGNGLRGSTNGLETAVDFRPADWMRWRGSWTLFDKELNLRPGSTDTSGGSAEGNDPRQTLGLRATVNLPSDIEIDGFLRAIAALPSPPVPGYAELDLRAGWWITPDLEISFTGRNLLHDRHPEFGAAGRRIEFERQALVRLATFF